VTYDDIHPTLRQLVGTREGFRKMGYAAEDLYVELGRNPFVGADELMAFTTLMTHGKIFRVDAGPWPMNDEAGFAMQWRAACEALNSGQVSDDDLDRIWKESAVYKNKVDFVMALSLKGFIPPGSLS
jgi:hypothetical protein